jgi:hypothetical protein
MQCTAVCLLARLFLSQLIEFAGLMVMLLTYLGVGKTAIAEVSM